MYLLVNVSLYLKKREIKESMVCSSQGAVWGLKQFQIYQ